MWLVDRSLSLLVPPQLLTGVFPIDQMFWFCLPCCTWWFRLVRWIVFTLKSRFCRFNWQTQELETHTDICHGAISRCWWQLQSRRTWFPLLGCGTDLCLCSAWVGFLSVAAFVSSQDVQVAQCRGVVCRCALKDDVPVKSQEGPVWPVAYGGWYNNSSSC